MKNLILIFLMTILSGCALDHNLCELLRAQNCSRYPGSTSRNTDTSKRSEELIKSSSIKSIIQDQGKGIVLISTFDKSGEPLKIGSGFIIKPEGTLITNYHVIEGAYSAAIQFTDGKTLDDVSVIGFDAEWDIALLKVNGNNLKAVKLGDSDKVQAGEHIIVIGNPEGLQNTVSDGLISSIRKLKGNEYLFQISAPISKGSSGGPVFNENGEVIGVIGISTLMLETGQNLNFAIPIKFALPLIMNSNKKGLPAFSSEQIKKKTEDYLVKQKISTEFKPEETIFEKALEHYKKAESAGGRFLSLLGTQNQDAIKHLKKAIEADPNYHAAHYVLGLSYMWNDFSFAEESLLTAIAIKPNFSKGYENLGELYHRMGNRDKAEDAYNTALALTPNQPWIHIPLGQISREKKNYEEALEHFRSEIALNENSVSWAYFETAKTYSEMQDFSNSLDAFKNVGSISLTDDDFETTLRMYKESYNANRKNSSFLQSYAFLYYLKSDYKSAITYFVDSIKVLEGNSKQKKGGKAQNNKVPLSEVKFKANFELASSYYYNFEYAKAAEYVERALEEEPNDHKSLDLKGDIYSIYYDTTFKPDLDKAIMAYERAISVNPNESNVHFKLGDVLFRKNKYAVSKQHILKAISLNENNISALERLADIYKEEKHFDEALKTYEKVILNLSERNPKNNRFQIAMINNKVGNIYEDLFNFSAALIRYQRAYDDLGLDFFEDNIANMYSKLGKPEQAIEIYNRRILKDSNNADAHFRLGSIYFNSNQLNEAIKSWTKASSLKPSEASTHYNLGLAYAKLGKEEDTKMIIFHFKEYLKLTENVEGEENDRKLALSNISILEFPIKLKRLKEKGGELGALASLLLIEKKYSKGNDKFIGGLGETKYKDGQNEVSPDVFVAENIFESFLDEVKKIKRENSEIQEISEKFEKAARLRIDGIKIHNEGYYLLKKDYKGEYEKGAAKIKIADNEFLEALRAIQSLMRKYANEFSSYELEFVSSDISYYSTKYKN